MNKLPKYRNFIVATIGILSVVMSLGASGRALAAQSAADVSITMVADQNQIKVGQNVTYTVTATNLGPDAALFVDVTHGLSDQLNFVSVTCDGGISSDGPFCEYSILEPGESAVSILVATPRPDIRNYERKLITATATVSFETADTIDSNTGNNWASVTIKVIGKVTHS